MTVNGGDGNETASDRPRGRRRAGRRARNRLTIARTEAANDTVVNGGGGDDTLGPATVAAVMHVTLDGGDGNDAIGGGDGPDTLAGGPGNDAVATATGRRHAACAR